METKNYSYITLITNDQYMPSLITLLRSFSLIKSRFPISVMVLPEVSENSRAIIKFLGADIIEVSKLFPKNFNGERFGTEDYTGVVYHTCTSKLHVFELTQFDKVVYVDADTVFIKNTDELFLCPHMSAVVDFPVEQFNAGVMVVVPNKDLYNNLLETLATFDGENGAFESVYGLATCLDDQTVLHKFYADWPNNKLLHLVDGYNIRISHCNNLSAFDLSSLSDAKIIHITIPEKPWHYNDLDSWIWILNDKWQFTLMQLAICNWWYIQIMLSLKYLEDNNLALK